MKNLIKSLEERYTFNTPPDVATTVAQGLIQLSSGIYTEEERYIFELLQNAVDAHNSSEDYLNIKIVQKDEHLVFMHNGEAFSERDIKGLCDIGNGNKAGDSKKIGYKGIGFKSVFIRSSCVTVESGGYCFKFDKSHWKNFWDKNWQDKYGEKEHDKRYLMPWQIIPIETKPPIRLPKSEYNVITYIQLDMSSKIADKITKLLANSQFLLFLNVANIRITYEQNGSTLNCVEKTTCGGEVCLSSNGQMQSKWLIYSNDKLKVPAELMEDINADINTPEKLKGAETFDLSFAILLESDGRIKKVDRADAVIYTYLPTTYKFGTEGFPFLVNANFITDAGRQQLQKDSVWNKLIFSNIPSEFLKWVAQISPTYSNYYEILPKKTYGNENDLEKVFTENMEEAIEKIKFVPNLSNKKLLLVAKTIYDEIGMNEGLTKKRFNSFLTKQFYLGCTADNLIDVEAGVVMQKYGSRAIDNSSLGTFLEHTNENLDGFSLNECVKFCKWLSKICEEASVPKEMLSYSTFLIDEKDNLVAPHELFFPSDYRDENSIAESAKVISTDLLEKLENEGLKDWLLTIGVQEMSHLSIIKNLICSGTFFDGIAKEEAIKAIRFIFDSEGSELILANLEEHDKSRLKFLTEKGSLEYASSLYLNLLDYGIGVEKGFDEELDVFISNEYVRESDEKLKWAIFLKELGVNDNFYLVTKRYERDTELWNKFSRLIDFACDHECNIGSWGNPFYMQKHTVSIVIKTIPLLNISDNKYEVSKMVWKNTLTMPLSLRREDDYIYGSTGCGFTAKGYLKDKTSKHEYLGENFLPYALKNFNWLPGSDGKLYRVEELLDNSPSNKDLCGKYLPTLDVDCQIHDSWLEYLSFKKDISLNEYLTILEKIEKDSDNGVSKENLDRISLVYRHIADKFSLEEGTSEYNIIAEWAKFHKILTSERLYKSPTDLLLVSDDLGKIAIDNQVFRGNHIRNYDVRFVNLMKAFGVKFVDSFTPSFEGEGEVNNNFNKRLMSLSRYLSLLTVGKDATKDIYQTELEKIENEIASWVFIGNDQISLSYAGLSIERKVYVKEKEFHYVGSLGISNLELMHEAIAKGLNIPPSNRTAMMAIIQIGNVEEIREYLTEKGFDVSFVEEGEIECLNSPIVTLGEGNYLDQLAQEGLNEEARRVVLQMLAKDGFDITNKREEYSLVHRVMMNEEEFPLVIKFRKGSAMSIELNCFEWIQLMRSENSMLLIHRGNGVVEKLSFSNLFRNNDCMSIRFNIEALQHPNNILQFAELLQYFKGCHFDFSNLHTTRYESMQGYIKGQKNPNAFIDLSPDDKKLLN